MAQLVAALAGEPSSRLSQLPRDMLTSLLINQYLGRHEAQIGVIDQEEITICPLLPGRCQTFDAEGYPYSLVTVENRHYLCTGHEEDLSFLCSGACTFRQMRVFPDVLYLFSDSEAYVYDRRRKILNETAILPIGRLELEGGQAIPHWIIAGLDYYGTANWAQWIFNGESYHSGEAIVRNGYLWIPTIGHHGSRSYIARIDLQTPEILHYELTIGPSFRIDALAMDEGNFIYFAYSQYDNDDVAETQGIGCVDGSDPRRPVLLTALENVATQLLVNQGVIYYR